MDRQKIIENMNIAKAVLCNPNMVTPEMCIKIGQTISDALSLLKEQEPIEPITSDGDDLYWQPGDEDYACGACGEELAGSWWVYCPYCGRKVKWE